MSSTVTELPHPQNHSPSSRMICSVPPYHSWHRKAVLHSLDLDYINTELWVSFVERSFWEDLGEQRSETVSFRLKDASLQLSTVGLHRAVCLFV